MLLYVHVPFCVRKCGYCAFHSGPFSRDAAEAYVEMVLREMKAWGRTLGRVAVETVYFGGGTPSLLEPGQVEDLLQSAGACFNLDADAEITLEANPDSVLRPGFLGSIRRLGVNRLSLGVQSLQDDLLAMLGRPHDGRQARRSVQAARDSGFNLSLDLIWGLPGQTLKRWMDDLAEVAALAPEHLSCYGLSLEDGTSLARQVEEGDLDLPGEETQARMYLDGTQFLESVGYAHYEISSYARPGRKSRHNQGYWAGKDYLGFGPAAVSTIGDRRWSNPVAFEEYASVVTGGGGTNEVEVLSTQMRRQEMVMLALRTAGGLDLEKFKATTGTEFPWRHPAVEQLRSSGLVRHRDGHLQLTREGMLVSNSVIEMVLGIVDRMHADTV
ncbi:MAG: radical SAM family heme chaperone HemW [Desulfomicrobium sp.]|nr:radical SAM family heme chaperone HemW [Pseudomonadota bacterium]MBV1714029.1 radical SAM family heme chaperone HemW [Desulfomicrobium sp.]MBU4571566.1 radical SAM family heme chaperone HemW [Pseudomonadota bacterium]MBU4595714.1 radical SAM family heme chaperone HemW [Pseudomonadota bacterium]MBV1721632.1 radical SAM family heme chaperone HemW [Desulfomicrobium sp.]